MLTILLIAASTTVHAQWMLTGNNLPNPVTNPKWLGTNNARDLIVKTNGSEAMRIKGTTGADNHWIGIGMDASIPNPLNQFHLHNGAIRLTGTVAGYGGPMILFGGDAVNAVNGEWGIEYTSAIPIHGLNFWKPFGSTNGGGNYFLFLSDNGNVGINTSTPAERLEVFGGDARIHSLTVGLGGGFIATNTATGYQALLGNTTGAYNTAIGNNALKSNTVKNWNTAVGYEALQANNEESNTAVGSQALFSNTFGTVNAAVGNAALAYNTLGSNNTAMGTFASTYNIAGSNNTALGAYASYYGTAYNNTAIGEGALYSSQASSNTAVGYQSLFYNYTGTQNTGLGATTDVGVGNSNATAIGYGASANLSNEVRIGNSSVSVYSCQVDWTLGSDARIKDNVQENVPGLQFISKLRPVTFHYNVTKQNKLMGIVDTAKWAGKYDIEKIAFTGFLAQDVDAAASKIGYDFSGVDKSGKVMGLRYTEFVVPLVKAVQELSSKNDSLAQQNQVQQQINSDLQKQLDDLKYSIAQMQNAMSECCSSFQSSDGKAETLPSSISDQPRLDQISPNPFSQTAIITFSLPSDVSNAQLIITDATGKTVSNYSLSNGSTQQLIAAKNLAAGTYQYSLIVNGKVVDSKQMVIVK